MTYPNFYSDLKLSGTVFSDSVFPSTKSPNPYPYPNVYFRYLDLYFPDSIFLDLGCTDFDVVDFDFPDSEFSDSVFSSVMKLTSVCQWTMEVDYDKQRDPILFSRHRIATRWNLTLQKKLQIIIFKIFPNKTDFYKKLETIELIHIPVNVMNRHPSLFVFIISAVLTIRRLEKNVFYMFLRITIFDLPLGTCFFEFPVLKLQSR